MPNTSNVLQLYVVLPNATFTLAQQKVLFDAVCSAVNPVIESVAEEVERDIDWNAYVFDADNIPII